MVAGGKESACNAGVTGDEGSIPGWGRSTGGGQTTSVFLPGECQDRGARQTVVHMVTKN